MLRKAALFQIFVLAGDDVFLLDFSTQSMFVCVEVGRPDYCSARWLPADPADQALQRLKSGYYQGKILVQFSLVPPDCSRSTSHTLQPPIEHRKDV